MIEVSNKVGFFVEYFRKGEGLSLLTFAYFHYDLV